MVDPFSEAEAATPAAGEPLMDTSSNLKKLFDAWGIEHDSSTRSWAASRDGRDRDKAVDYCRLVQHRRPETKSDPATADLSQVTVAMVRAGEEAGRRHDLLPALEQRPCPASSGLLQGGSDPHYLAHPRRTSGPGRAVVDAARARGVLHSASRLAPPAAGRQARGIRHSPAYKAETSGPVLSRSSPPAHSSPTGLGCRRATSSAAQDATPFSHKASSSPTSSARSPAAGRADRAAQPRSQHPALHAGDETRWRRSSTPLSRS